jgi:murein peptide amidase A
MNDPVQTSGSRLGALVSRRGRIALACLCGLLAASGASSLAATSRHATAQARSGSASSALRPKAFATVVIGHSRLGRRIVADEFGSGARRLLVIGGVHGREFGRVVARQLIVYLADHPRSIPPGAQIDIVPCLNPDGSALHRRGNSHNVDLNRNLPTANWTSSLQAGDPSAQTCSGGPAPASEPETKALLRYLRQGFTCVISLHSQGGFLDFNGPHARAVAQAMSRACGLPVRRIFYQGAITGSLGGYVPAVYRIPVITVELRDSRLSNGLIEAVLRVSRVVSAS